MNWYIGQEIVCIKTHSDKYVVEGKIYTIKGLNKCCNINIDVGFTHNCEGTQCPICGHIISSNTAWFSEKLFAPLADISELEELLKEQPQKV